MTAIRRIAFAAVLAACGLGASQGAAAQGASRQLLPDMAIPAAPAGPDAGMLRPDVLRRVTLVQLGGDGAPFGAALVLTCPAAGCQDAITLVVENRPEQFGVAVTFVAGGTYVNLEPRALGTARIVEYGVGRAGPAFIVARARGIASRDLRYVVSRDATLRSVDRTPEAKTLSDGYVFTRKLEWDVSVRVEVQTPAP